jgi:hypothetical protein
MARPFLRRGAPGCLTAGMLSRWAWSLSIAALGSGASDAEAAAPSESPEVERPSREVLVGGGISSMAAPRDSALELGPGLNVLVTPISLNLSIGWAGRPAPWLMPGGSR